MSNNCLFSYPDRTLTAVLTGGSWRTQLPLLNLASRLRSKCARSNNALAGSTWFDIALPTARSVQVIALLSHNASQTATITVSISNTSPGGSELGHYVDQPLWGPYWPTSTPWQWEEDEYWLGTLCDADAADYRPSPDYWICLPAAVAARWIRIEISDTANPAGYFQLGRCFVGPGLQAEINLDYGAGHVWRQDVLREQSIGGVEWYEVRSSGREITGTLSHLSSDEGLVLFYERQRRLGQEGELYFILDPSDTVGLYRQRAMLCRFADEDPLKYPYHEHTAGSFTLKEVR